MTDEEATIRTASAPADAVWAAGRAVRAGAAGVDVLRSALDAARLFALRPPTPGVLAFSVPGGGRWTVVFTSPQGLARFARDRGQVVADWMSTTGADLIDQLPAGVGLLVDPGEEHCVALPALWLHTGAGSGDTADRLTKDSMI